MGPRLCLVTGATGYVGGRLVPELLAAGHRVRVLARTPSKLNGRPWRAGVEVVQGDAQDDQAVRQAMDSVDVAYYLLHSIGTGKDFTATERRTAGVFAKAAAANQVGRIVYLGGLDPDGEELSEHLASRAEVGRVLLASGVPTVVLRAGVIIGSGSASFEMLRYLTERLPVMVTPRWVHTRIQPIAIRDVLRYLVSSADLPPDVNRAFDIAGPDVLTYLGMMQRFAAVTGLPRRRILPVPVLSPSLSSHWVNVVTPVPRSLARPLVESLRNTAVATEHDIAAYVPDPPDGLIGYDHAVELALTKIQNLDVPTSWASAATGGAPSEPLPSDPDWAGGSLYVDQRERAVHARPESLWTIIEGIGGRRGWYSFPLGWRVRGWIDRLTGGPGLVRGRRDPDSLLPGDSLDWWRVEQVEEGRMLLLRAEMRLPGLAWLELSIVDAPLEEPAGTVTVFHQRALFHPRGIAGHAYWWAVWPFHGLVFGSMQRNVSRAAEELDGHGRAPTVNQALPRPWAVLLGRALCRQAELRAAWQAGEMTEFPNESTDPVDEAGQAGVPDQEEQFSQEQPYDSLVDRGVDDVLDEGYSPPERYSSAERFGNTAEEMLEGESFQERLRQEVPEDEADLDEDEQTDPDHDPLEIPPEDDFLGDGEVGDDRAGRLVDPNEGIGDDEEKDLVGDDVGIDGAAASAEEAAVHVVDED